ncbi:MAG TPA: hypothetical protein PLG60_03840, partial [Acidimicrobiales bacterium]|nr:hypothetical protein [Acidimicrobiales bacterium]
MAPVSLELVGNWTPNADETAAGMLGACEGVARGRTGAWRASPPGLLALMTTVRGRPYNGVYGLNASATPEDATALAQRLAQSGVSWCARLRPSVPEGVGDALRALGLFEEDEVLLMATSLVPDDAESSPSPELTVSARRSGDELAIARVLAGAFATPPSSAAKLLEPAHLACEGIEWHLGEVEGEPVA